MNIIFRHDKLPFYIKQTLFLFSVWCGCISRVFVEGQHVNRAIDCLDHHYPKTFYCYIVDACTTADVCLQFLKKSRKLHPFPHLRTTTWHTTTTTTSQTTRSIGRGADDTESGLFPNVALIIGIAVGVFIPLTMCICIARYWLSLKSNPAHARPVIANISRVDCSRPSFRTQHVHTTLNGRLLDAPSYSNRTHSRTHSTINTQTWNTSSMVYHPRLNETSVSPETLSPPSYDVAMDMDPVTATHQLVPSAPPLLSGEAASVAVSPVNVTGNADQGGGQSPTPPPSYDSLFVYSNANT